MRRGIAFWSTWLVVALPACSPVETDTSAAQAPAPQVLRSAVAAGTACPPTGGMEVGGSNYVLWDASAYLAHPTEETWYTPGALKPVIGTFHQGPATVRAQLADMFSRRQRKLSLMLWFANLMGTTDSGVWGHVVDSRGARLSPQHQQNLRDLLAAIRDTGFTELHFRFAPQGGSEPGGWAAWNEAQYQENWNFIVSTRQLVEQALAGGSVRVLYDLSAEAGGFTHGQFRAYTKRLWQDWVYSFGTANTFGFSFAVAPGRLATMLRIYDETGHRPPAYAFDIYGGEASALGGYLADELASGGELGKPVYIEEAYSNDATANAAFRQAAASRGLNLRSITQWPVARGATSPHFSMNYAAAYDAYYGWSDCDPWRPEILAAGAGCDDRQCLWIHGSRFASDARVELRRNDGSEPIIATYSGASLTRPSEDLITLRLSDPALVNLFATEGLRIWVVNGRAGVWSNAQVVRQ